MGISNRFTLQTPSKGFGRIKPPPIEEQTRAFLDDTAASELFMLDPNTCTDRMVALNGWYLPSR